MTADEKEKLETSQLKHAITSAKITSVTAIIVAVVAVLQLILSRV